MAGRTDEVGAPAASDQRTGMACIGWGLLLLGGGAFVVAGGWSHAGAVGALTAAGGWVAFVGCALLVASRLRS